MKRIFLLVILTAFALVFIGCNKGTADAGTSAAETTAGETSEAVSEDTSSAESEVETTVETAAETDSETTAEETDLADGMLPEGNVRIMSFNLDANEATIKARSKNIIPMILEQLPDSIGVQECRGTWNKTITKGLDEKYGRIGVAADGNSESSGAFATYIFYLKDKYNVIDSGTFWLSTTPDVPSKYNNVVDCNRTCTWAILQNKETGCVYAHVNSHLDWMDVSATDYQIQMIRRFIEMLDGMGIPTFATGDYNTDEGSSTYKLMLAGDGCIVGDSKFVAEKTMSLGTYPSYGEYDVTVEKPIDFCFVTKNRVKVTEYKVIDDKPNGDYMSDHNALRIDAVIYSTKDTYAAADTPDVPSVGIPSFKYNSAVGTIGGSSAGTQICSYEVWLTDANGKEVFRETVAVPFRDKNYRAGDSVSFNATGLSETTEYTVHVTAKNAFGKVSAEGTAVFTTSKKPETQQVGAPDLFELGFADGNYIDLSEKGSAITKVGTVNSEKEGYLASFSGNGNLKVPDFKNYYSELEDGFTMEATIKFGSDVNTFKSIVSNMHAGGFGLSVENGKADFSVYVKGQYVGAQASVSANTEYCIVGVYDGSTVKLYLNGELAAETSVSGKMTFATDNGAKYLCIGADSDASGNGEYMISADFKSVRIYSDPLTAEQVAGINNK